MAWRMLTAGILLGAACMAQGDTITVNGQTYRDVLIRTSPNFYYVTLPDEGRVMTVERSQVDPSTVSIVEDQVYRDTLKARYDANRTAPKTRSYKSLDESQVVADARALVDAANESQFTTRPDGSMPEGSDLAAGAAGSATADGLGITAAQLQQAVQAAGVTMQQQGTQAGHPRYVGQSSGGKIQVDAYGPEENLRHLGVVMTASDIGQLQALAGGLSPLIVQVAPWVEQWIVQNQAALMTMQPIEATQNNVRATAQIAPSGTEMSITISFDTVG